jgi:hypothetical protein
MRPNKSQTVEIRHGAEMPAETRAAATGDNDVWSAMSE